MFEISGDINKKIGAKIKVVGVGGGGCNAVNTMIRSGLTGVEYIVANTDAQALNANLAETKIQLGSEVTKGLGAGANPEVGRKAALEDYDKINEVLDGADMVFITAGMGGGTGTGAAPVIAKLAREMGALTVGVITKPFGFEGKKRMRQAENGIKELKECVDSLITIPNQKLLTLAGETLSLVETFKRADEVLLNAVQGISDLINNTGLINADFADVSTVMKNKGLALMGTGIAEGSDRAIKAATAAISSPLLEDVSIDGATGIIINITGSNSLSIQEANEAMTLIMEAADEDAEIIFGTVIDDNMNDEIKVTVIATGLASKVDEHAFIETAKTSNTNYSYNAQPNTNLNSVGANDFAAKLANTTSNSISSWENRSEQQLSSEPSYIEPKNTTPSHIHPQAVNVNVVGRNIHDAANRYEQQKSQVTAPTFGNNESSISSSQTQSTNAKEENWDLSPKTKSIAEKLGFMNFDDDQFDKPSFMRKEKGADQVP